MEGDKLVIKPEHTVIAEKVLEAISGDIEKTDKYTISIGGESGSGKSELASELERLLESKEIETGILQLDDYFIFPSRTCHRMRMNNIEQVGMFEARLDFMECHLRSFKRGDADIYKPLSIYGEDRFTTEVMEIKELQVMIAEGSYTVALRFVDCHIFIDRDFEDTRADRQERARDILDQTMVKILEREHDIIKEHKKLAEIIVDKDFSDIEITGDTAPQSI